MLSYDEPVDEIDPSLLSRKVVVKEINVNYGEDENNEEHMISDYVSKAKSTHLVKLIRASDDRLDENEEDYPTTRNCRLYLEYCPYGDLQNLVHYRRSRLLHPRFFYIKLEANFCV